jgi:hypothetical protein
MRSAILALAFWTAGVLPGHAQTVPAGGDTSAAQASNSEFDLQSYQQELSRIEESAKNQGQLRQLRRSLPDSWTVRDGDRTYRVPTKEISDALMEIEHDPKKASVAEQLDTRLKAMKKQAQDLSLPSTSSNRAESEAKLKKILARSEYQAASGPTPWELLRARISRWIFEHLLRLFRLLNISEKTGNAIAWGVIFLAVVVLFYAVYGWLSKSSKNVSFRAEAEPTKSDARQWVHEALIAADRGDFREAIHCAYWASVARLEDLRILPRDRARTPRESLRLLEHHPREQSGIQAITQKFELIWYGFRPASANDWAGAKEELEKMGCLQDSTAPIVPS